MTLQNEWEKNAPVPPAEIKKSKAEVRNLPEISSRNSKGPLRKETIRRDEYIFRSESGQGPRSERRKMHPFRLPKSKKAKQKSVTYHLASAFVMMRSCSFSIARA